MKVGEFRKFAAELGRQMRESGDAERALALEKLAKIFDGHDKLTVAAFVKKLRSIRKLDAA